MQRTQIYLSDHDLAMLDREVERTGRTRSRLIRDAIDRAYSDQVDADEFERVLRAAAGAWKNRPFTGAEFVDAVRGRRPGGLAALWPEGYGPDADPG
jgi:Arc/MetJ-type ribon-helix-helix transcriptional regulator